MSNDDLVARLRQHSEATGLDGLGKGHCYRCLEKWPCPAAEAADALDERDALLREVLYEAGLHAHRVLSRELEARIEAALKGGTE